MAEPLWAMYLDPQAIDDEVFPPLEVGQTREFALRVQPTHLLVTEDQLVGCHALPDGSYAALAEVVYTWEGVWVIDCGVRGYVWHDTPLPEGRAGLHVAGRLTVEVDWFLYRDHLAHLPDMPRLRYTWRVERITAWNPETRSYDRPCDRAEDGPFHYLLHCTRLPLDPR